MSDPLSVPPSLEQLLNQQDEILRVIQGQFEKFLATKSEIRSRLVQLGIDLSEPCCKEESNINRESPNRSPIKETTRVSHKTNIKLIPNESKPFAEVNNQKNTLNESKGGLMSHSGVVDLKQKRFTMKPYDHPKVKLPSLLDARLKCPKTCETMSPKRVELTRRDGCWNCGELFHRYPACPHPFQGKFCYHCGELGVKSYSCPNCRSHK